MQTRKSGVGQTIGIMIVASSLTFVFIMIGGFAAAWYVNFGPGKEAHDARRKIEKAEYEAELRERHRRDREGSSSWKLPPYRVGRIVTGENLKPETNQNGSSDLAAS